MILTQYKEMQAPNQLFCALKQCNKYARTNSNHSQLSPRTFFNRNSSGVSMLPLELEISRLTNNIYARPNAIVRTFCLANQYEQWKGV